MQLQFWVNSSKNIQWEIFNFNAVLPYSYTDNKIKHLWTSDNHFA